MAKAQTFADKAKKGTEARGKKCPVCGSVMQPVLLVASERSAGKASWKFTERRVQVCKCNEKEVYA